MSDVTLSALWLTLRVATAATALVFIPGVLLGYYSSRSTTLLSRVISALVALPLVLPPTAVGYLLLRFLSADGPFGAEIFGFQVRLLLTWQAAVLAAAVMALPLVARTARVAFDAVDPQLPMMSRTLGYGRLETFLKTTTVLAGRGLLAAAILGYTRALGEFGATVMVAGIIPFKTQTLSGAIFAAQQVGDSGEVYFLIGLSLAIGFSAVYASEWLTRRPSVFH